MLVVPDVFRPAGAVEEGDAIINVQFEISCCANGDRDKEQSRIIAREDRGIDGRMTAEIDLGDVDLFTLIRILPRGDQAGKRRRPAGSSGA